MVLPMYAMFFYRGFGVVHPCFFLLFFILFFLIKS